MLLCSINAEVASPKSAFSCLPGNRLRPSEYRLQINERAANIRTVHYTGSRRLWWPARLRVADPLTLTLPTNRSREAAPLPGPLPTPSSRGEGKERGYPFMG